MAGLPNLFGRSATFVDRGEGSSAQEDDVKALNGDFRSMTLESGVKSQSFNKEKIGDERSATIVRGEGSSAQEDDVQKSKFEPHLRSMILVPGLEDQVQKLRSRFSDIQAALSDAESRYVTEKTEQAWLEKLRDISYEIDDVLDVWDTALLKIRIINDEEKNAQNIGSSYYNNPSPCSWLEQLAQDNNLPTRIDELNEKFGVIAREKDIYRFKSETLVAAVPQHQKSAVPHREESTSFIDASMVFGRDREIELITSELGPSSLQESGLDIISIVGMGGMGKTTIAQCIYNDIETEFEKKIWVCVSDPFDGLRVAKSIVEELDGPAQNYTTLQSSLKYINGSIRGKKFMLVLDDVWTEDYKDWEPFSIALRNGAGGSKILVTTRNAKVANMMRSTYTHHLGKLSEDYSWELFSRVAFFNKDEAERENLKELGQIVVERCEGLPLALKVIGSHLRLKTTEREWRNVVNNELWALPVVEEEIFRPLLLSYYDLPSPIKRCLSYCAIYPKDKKIKPEELIWLWMSQGYLDSTGREDKEAVGQEYYGELVIRSFFQHFQYEENDGSIRACKMHDIVHDFCQFLAKNECITSITITGNDPGMSSSTSKKFYHLGMSNVRRSEDVISNLGVQNLHTLLLRSSRNLDGGMDFHHLSRQLKFLKALDLSWCGIIELPDELGQFVHLRYLNLSGNDELKRLPETIYGMCNLQTLLLDECRGLRKLPKGIEKLIKLRHLQISYRRVLPKGIGRICSLRTLSEFLVCRSEDSAGASIEDLGKLNNLQGCFRISQLKNVVDEREAMKARLMDKIEVTHLLLDFKDGEGIKDEDGVVEGLQPHRSLKGLAIRYYSGKLLPSWITSLSKLRALVLEFCDRCDGLPPLGKLSSLEHLIVRGMDNLTRIGEAFLGITTVDIKLANATNSPVVAFPKLTDLYFSGMEKWEEWEGKLKAKEMEGNKDAKFEIFPRLRYLEIQGCGRLKALPQYIQMAPIEEFRIARSPIVELSWITSLSKLRTLFLKSCDRCDGLPPLGKLSSLEHLVVKGMANLTRIGEDFLGITTVDIKLANATNSPVVAFPKLTRLTFKRMEKWEEWEGKLIAKEMEGNKDAKFKIFPRLRFLQIFECPELKALPQYIQMAPIEELYTRQSPIVELNWITSLSKLSTLKLDSCDRCDGLPPLGKLSSLEHLTVRGMDNLTRIGEDFLGITTVDIKLANATNSPVVAFPKLTYLKFKRMRNWERWEGKLIAKEMEGNKDAKFEIFPRLRYLRIVDCPRLKALPQYIQMAPIEELRIAWSPTIEKRCKRNSGEDWHKISHIPTVRIWDWNTGRWIEK